MIDKVISGGQTGVDRAGLDAALRAGLAIGGYCPKERRAEDGAIPDRYPLRELETPEYHCRTERNVIESDGTLILNLGVLSEGTKLTHQYALQHGKPCLVVQLDAVPLVEPARVGAWINSEEITVLNVAGPRESKCRGGIYRRAYAFLVELFNMLTSHNQ